MEKEKKKINGYKISTIILSILFGISIIIMIHFSLQSKNTTISYNGIEYENEYAYVNLVINNNSGKQIVFDKTNFSIKSTDITKTSSALYYEKEVNYIQLTGSYILNNGDTVKIKLQFNKNDVTTENIICFNGKNISKL